MLNIDIVVPKKTIIIVVVEKDYPRCPLEPNFENFLVIKLIDKK